VLSLALVLPIAPLLDRIVFRPIADASVLLLLTVAVALHFALSGLGLMFFGPEGVRTKPLTDTVFDVAGLIVNGQMLLILAASIVFCGLLFLYFEFTIQGKALRATAVNATGARLVGIRPASTGTMAYLLASLLAGISGVLIAPVTTIFYDSGFLIGLKAFVGAIIGGLVSYPLAAVGAIMVGLLESFASFWSSAFKEVIVFGALIPILIWQSIVSSRETEEEIEDDEREGQA
jgi:branched-chain amino acid transport system permease protein